MRYLLLLLIVFPLAVPAQVPETTLRTSVSEVLLDVVVRDKKARIVPDLRPDEVQVFEDGVPQKVRHFEFFDAHSTPQGPGPANSTTSAASTQPVSTPSEPASPHDVNELRDMTVVSLVLGNLGQYDRTVVPKILQDFLKNDLQANTYVGVFRMSYTLQTLLPYTNDAGRISATVDRVLKRPNPGQAKPADTGSVAALDQPATDPAATASDGTVAAPTSPTDAPVAGPAAALAQLMATNWGNDLNDVYDSSVRQLTELRTLVQAQATIPGRKIVLLISDGVTVHPGMIEALEGAISVANRANVTIYGIDIRGFERSRTSQGNRLLTAAANASRRRQLALVNGGDQTVTPDELVGSELAEGALRADTLGNMEQLAEGTGGKVLESDRPEQLRRAMEDARAHYELTYSPTNTETDGRFRKIEVKVSRPGVTVFARSGYYALPLVNGRQVYPFEMATLKAINTKPMLRQFDFYATALQFRPGTDRTQLAFVFQVPARDLSITKDKQWAKVHVCVTALVKNEQGQVVEKISKDLPYQVPASKIAELQRGAVSFTAPFHLPPGRYTLETAAVDRESMKASVRRSLLVAGEASGLSMSDVAMVRRVDPIEGPARPADPLEARGGKVTPDLSEAIAPGADGQVEFYAVAYPPPPVDAPVEVGVEIWRDGHLVSQTPASDVPPDANGAVPILVGIPMDRLPSGQYEAQVSFQYKGQKVTKMTAFTVAPGS